MGSAELILGGALLLAAFSVYSLVSSLMANNSEKELLEWASGDEPVKSKSGLINISRPLVHNFTLKHAIKYKNPDYRNKIDKLLLHAGLKRELNVDEFIGLQILWGIGFPILFGILNFALDLDLPFLLVLAFIPLGFYYPRFYATSEKNKRGNAVRKDLPFFTDLLALSTEAGLDFVGALQKLVDKAPEGNIFAEEIGIVLRDIKLGVTRVDAIRGLAKRIDITEIMSFVAVLVDADGTGASIAQVLKDQSVQIRLERFVRAEKAGAKASQTMLIPMILFILPAIFMVVLGPIIVQFVTGK